MTESLSPPSRSHWIAHARNGIEGEGAPDARALAILEATEMLAPMAATAEETSTLNALARVALKMASVRDDDLRRRDILGDVAKAWAAFDRVWAVPGRVSDP